jgi:hypothetical protein
MEKVKSGEKFQVKANTWNAFVDAARYVKNQSTNLKSDSNGFTGNPVFVKVVNDSGETWDIFMPLVLTEPLIKIESAADALKFAGQIPVFKAETYAGNSGTVGITQEVIKDGKIGKVMVAGISPVRMDSELPLNLIWQQEDWGIVNLTGGAGYSGPFKLVVSELGIEVVNGMNPDDLHAGYILFNGKIMSVETGFVLSSREGHVCLIAEIDEADEAFVYFDIIDGDLSEIEEDIAVYPLGYAESNDENEITNTIQFHHAMPELWLTDEC